jgi:soluble lytic murein transglycosylase-like protein
LAAFALLASLSCEAQDVKDAPSPQPVAAYRCGTNGLSDSPLPAVKPSSIAPERAAPFTPAISNAAKEHGLPQDLLHAIVSVESAFNPSARSPKGAIGLMQIIPATGKRFGADDLTDPQDNLRTGARYLKWLLERFDNSLPLALAAYNAGEGAVQKHDNRIPPYSETRQYVAKVLSLLDNCGGNSPTLATREAQFAVTPTAATRSTNPWLASDQANAPSPNTLDQAAGLVLKLLVSPPTPKPRR